MDKTSTNRLIMAAVEVLQRYPAEHDLRAALIGAGVDGLTPKLGDIALTDYAILRLTIPPEIVDAHSMSAARSISARRHPGANIAIVTLPNQSVTWRPGFQKWRAL